jgi:Domain of unknown function (DUF4189)
MRRLYVLLVSAVIATTLIVVATGVSASPSPSPSPGGAGQEYGALVTAFSLQQYEGGGHPELVGFWGHGTTLHQAKRSAVQDCWQTGNSKKYEPTFKADCKKAAWVRNGYLALAVNVDPNSTGWAWAKTEAEAKRDAVAFCKKGISSPSHKLDEKDCKVSEFLVTDKPFTSHAFAGGNL